MMCRFAGCMLDTDARQLFRGAGEVHLSPKAFELLALLVERRPRALSKTELLDAIWPNVFVSDASLARVVNEVRGAVGDSPRHARVVRTVHRYGYAFVAVVDQDAPARPVPSRPQHQCSLACDGREFPLSDGEYVAGRDADVDLRLDSPRVSRRHARIVVAGTRAAIEDLGSKNGTFVSGLRIAKSTPLQAGSQVRMGPFSFVFLVGHRSDPTETENGSV
jgi:DNA-binding winged helix-turn-helix (wHTH) protein